MLYAEHIVNAYHSRAKAKKLGTEWGEWGLTNPALEKILNEAIVICQLP